MATTLNEIEAFANLVDWEVIATGAGDPDGLAHHEELPPGHAARFYRVKLVEE